MQRAGGSDCKCPPLTPVLAATELRGWVRGQTGQRCAIMVDLPVHCTVAASVNSMSGDLRIVAQ
jgi:hypothetical protein